MAKRDPLLRSENSIQGDLAESITCRLLRSLGFHIKYTGIEVVHSDLLLLRRLNRLSEAKITRYKSLPDFIASKEGNEKLPDGLSLEIEVKHRSDSIIAHNEICDYSDNVHFIFLDPHGFWSIQCRDLKEKLGGKKKSARLDSLTAFEEDKIFQFSFAEKEKIRLYKAYAALISRVTIRKNVLEF